ncbi:hypothetical protein ES703_83217 [subsurface metagenome]
MPKVSLLPKWATPERRAKLVELFCRSGGFCIFGEPNCAIPSHHYEIFIEGLILDWKADDREARRIEYRLESIRLHSLAEPRQPLRGRFSAISQDIWNSSQPLYYIEGLGISGLTLQPFVRVRLSSSYLRLYVNLGEALRGVSKSKKRKAIRYGKPLPKTIEQAINQLVKSAVLDYLAH